MEGPDSCYEMLKKGVGGKGQTCRKSIKVWESGSGKGLVTKQVNIYYTSDWLKLLFVLANFHSYGKL